MEVLTVDYRSSQASQRFTDSLRSTGFAVISQHPIDMHLVNDVYQEWASFFASAAKFDYLFNKESQDGYFPFLSENAKGYVHKDLKEFYHFYLWGKCPSLLSDKTRTLYQELSALAIRLLDWVELHTPENIAAQFSMPLSSMIADSKKTLLRILNYPSLLGTEPQEAVRAAAHEDINLITLLPAATAPGLQVKDTTGQWHDVQCDPGTIAVNIGDMLQMCSQGYYPSTTHQVINPPDTGNLPRLSMPLFLHPRGEVRLSAKHTADSYLRERLLELGLL
jgi:isopenicillin N synthase-like dioxygenase